jgi:hypothetical protein
VSARGKEVYIITAVVAAVLIVAWYFLLFSPKRSEISDLNNQIQAAQTSLTTAQSEVAQLEKAQKTAPQTRAEIVRLGKMLPGSEGIPSVIVEVTRTASDSGITVDTITPGDVQLGSPFGIQAMTLQVTGRFFDIDDFLYRLENYVAFRNASFRVTGRLFSVTNLTLASQDTSGGTSGTTTTTSGSPELTVTIGITGYLWSGATGSSGSSGGTANSAAATTGGAQ